MTSGYLLVVLNIGALLLLLLSDSSLCRPIKQFTLIGEAELAVNILLTVKENVNVVLLIEFLQKVCVKWVAGLIHFVLFSRSHQK